MIAWREFQWGQDEPNAANDRLPADTIEGADFTRKQAAAVDELVVCAYNVERGLCLDEQLLAFAGDAGMPNPDVLLISEADRGCTRTGNRNVAREYAEALGMCYVYAVEFTELPRIWGPGGRIDHPCEHGNAIISRYPLGNARLIRHARTRSWDSTAQRLLRVGQPRRGGRVALAADVRVGERFLRVYSVHFESGRVNFGPRRRADFRYAQAVELVDDAADVGAPVVIGGDMNVVRYLGSGGGRSSQEAATTALFGADFVDAHAGLPFSERVTTDSGVAIDLILGRGVEFKGFGVGPRDVWGGLSDHLPVWARVHL